MKNTPVHKETEKDNRTHSRDTRNNGTLQLKQHIFFIMGKHPTGHCEQYREANTVEQVLISCRKYVKERGEMYTSFRRLGRTGTEVRDLLGYGDT